MTKEELKRKRKYDDILQKYVHLIELGESEEKMILITLRESLKV